MRSIMARSSRYSVEDVRQREFARTLPGLRLQAVDPSDTGNSDATQVLKMTRPASASHPGSELDDFLFAKIGNDRNGLLLTVVSMLGRLDLDPWAEAVHYAGLPSQMAAQKLAAVIEAQPGAPLPALTAVTTAARLIALLPHRPDLRIQEPVISASKLATTRGAFLMRAILLALFVGLLLLGQFLVVNRTLPSRTVKPRAPAALAVPARAPPTFGK